MRCAVVDRRIGSGRCAQRSSRLNTALLLIVALAAVDAPKKFASLLVPLLLIVASAAVDVPKKLTALDTALLLIVCTDSPESFMIPSPWSCRVTGKADPTWIENALAPGLNVTEPMVTLSERVGEVCVEAPKVAVSPELTGAIPPDNCCPSSSRQRPEHPAK